MQSPSIPEWIIMVRLHSQESSSELVNGYLHCFLGFCGIGPFGLTFHYADPYGSTEPSISYRNLRVATPRTLSNAQSSIFIEVCPYDNILSYPSDKPHRLVGAARLHCATPSALLPPREQAPYGGEGKQIPALSRWKLVSERRPFHSEQSEIVLILPASVRSGSVALCNCILGNKFPMDDTHRLSVGDSS